MPPFVRPNSVVRRIWGEADSILLVFAGSAAEFALNRAVDWLFYTGALPADPIGRVFSTAAFAQEIVFVDDATAQRTLGRIRAIHEAVEARRGDRIPDWAHRDVLYMLIGYSERAHETLHRPLTAAEREELYDVFRRVGEGLGIPELPPDYDAWRADRLRHMERDLAYGALTAELYSRYRAELGWWRYALLLRVQALLSPPLVRALLRMPKPTWARGAVLLYRLAVRLGLRALAHRVLLPPRHRAAVRELDFGAAGRRRESDAVARLAG
ncbi:MAG TPA: oxygenase MpaB family protein [Gemmatimonadaceae bacterium]|nr:oxygenase MpaB family protein [Gemmatimonadaceae bacterium]